MYNGIGLETARGSGTNGYVQRNLSFIPRTKNKVNYKTEEQLKKADAELNKGPNVELLEHNMLRKIELKCLELQESLEEKGVKEEEITSKVKTLRTLLTEKEIIRSEIPLEKDKSGKLIIRDSHSIIAAQNERNARLRAVFGVPDDGDSSFERQARLKREADLKRAADMQSKDKNTLVESDHESAEERLESDDLLKKKKEKKRKRKAEREVKESSRDHNEHKKSKKQKKERKQKR